jgi:putative lipoic acid-binding regulatory protein
MSSVEQMAQFLILWDAVQQAQLNDRADEINWRWSSNGAYTKKSAYLAQLKGTYCTFDVQSIW